MSEWVEGEVVESVDELGVVVLGGVQSHTMHLPPYFRVFAVLLPDEHVVPIGFETHHIHKCVFFGGYGLDINHLFEGFFSCLHYFDLVFFVFGPFLFE